ncbi:hypothetical protein BDR05DRAFT_703125 [Suillus weaverae]|nr:hypothetical protein BDR05DRAFT_703125 [Suillus weaverae]
MLCNKTTMCRTPPCGQSELGTRRNVSRNLNGGTVLHCSSFVPLLLPLMVQVHSGYHVGNNFHRILVTFFFLSCCNMALRAGSFIHILER